jgi:hypothetical protein
MVYRAVRRDARPDIAISAAGGLVFMALGFRPEPKVKSRARVFAGGVASAVYHQEVVDLQARLDRFLARRAKISLDRY